jgi:putative membrane protein
MAISQPRSRVTTLWTLTGAVALGLIIEAFVPGVTLFVVVLQVVFALLHGARRYGWRAIGVFVVAGLVISNILENLSIRTGFPFGHYQYTGGGKIFLVPWFIGPAYLATGYLAWIVATVLLGDVRGRSSWLTTIGTPVIAAFAMTAWDLSLDPVRSTINRVWIWEHGGGFFGVPLTNFLGWTFTVYLFMQVFAVYLRTRGPQGTTERGEARAGNLHGVLLYGLTTLSSFAPLLTGARTVVVDATGRTWRTADIYQTSALVTIYGMLFIAALALLRMAQQSMVAPASTKVIAAERAEPGMPTIPAPETVSRAG